MSVSFHGPMRSRRLGGGCPPFGRAWCVLGGRDGMCRACARDGRLCAAPDGPRRGGGWSGCVPPGCAHVCVCVLSTCVYRILCVHIVFYFEYSTHAIFDRAGAFIGGARIARSPSRPGRNGRNGTEPRSNRRRRGRPGRLAARLAALVLASPGRTCRFDSAGQTSRSNQQVKPAGQTG